MYNFYVAGQLVQFFENDLGRLKRKIKTRVNPMKLFNILAVTTIFAIIPSFGQLIHSVTVEQRKSIRSLENVSKKLSNAKNAVVFNEICIKENLLPKYSHIYIYIYILYIVYSV